MRRLIIAAVAFTALALAIASAMTGAPAQAMPLSGLSGQSTSSAEPVYLRCRWVSDGYGGRVRQCVEVYDRPRYGYDEPRAYVPRYRPSYGYGGGY